jgi:hypothetical protein
MHTSSFTAQTQEQIDSMHLVLKNATNDTARMTPVLKQHIAMM